MKKLLELFALHEHKGDFGIEIEVEGQNLPNVNETYWRSEADGSLRGGLEYVLKAPIPLKNVSAVLKRLKSKLDANEAKLEFSFRTSVHVHMNMQQATYVQLLNTIYVYTLLEEAFMTFCSEARKANRFCLRIQDAQYYIDVLRQMFAQTEASFYPIKENQTRYSAMNIEALRKYCSLEFRAMEGNLDTERITTWCTALYRMREFAFKFNTPSEIYNLFIKKSPKEFFEEVLGDVSPAFTYKDLEQDIQKGFSLSIDLPFAYASASSKKKNNPIIEEAVQPPPLKPRKRPIIFDDEYL